MTATRERRLRDIAHVLRFCFCTTDELAVMFNVSARTIRRDLAELQAEPRRVPLVDRYTVRREWGVMVLEAECVD
jgi:hypothetical protein